MRFADASFTVNRRLQGFQKLEQRFALIWVERGRRILMSLVAVAGNTSVVLEAARRAGTHEPQLFAVQFAESDPKILRAFRGRFE